MTPTRLQLGTSRLEYLPHASLSRFLDKSWIHFGEAPGSPSALHKIVRRVRLARKGIKDIQSLYAKTNFEPFYFTKETRLPLESGSFDFVFSEHFFEHLRFDEAVALFHECYRVLADRGVVRISVPDADLRTYEPPEPAGFPDSKLPFTHPNKHKTRWSVYSLTEALRFCGFQPFPIRYCDTDGNYVRNEPGQYEGCSEKELLTDLTYLRRPDSLIVDGIKN